MHPLSHLRAPSGRMPMPVAATLAWTTVVLTLVAGLAALSSGSGDEAPLLHAAATQAATAPAPVDAAQAVAILPARLDDALPEDLPPTF